MVVILRPRAISRHPHQRQNAQLLSQHSLRYVNARTRLCAAQKLDRAAEQTDNPAHFDLLDQSLPVSTAATISSLCKPGSSLNFARASGEEINLLCDISGQPLSPSEAYLWDPLEAALRPDPAGNIRAPRLNLLLPSVKPPSPRQNIENVATILPPPPPARQIIRIATSPTASTKHGII